jgi:hypothetical protein
MQGISVFLKRMFTVFLDWVRPDSTVAKPRCMMNTSAAEIIIHRLFTVKSSIDGPLASSAGASAGAAGAGAGSGAAGAGAAAGAAAAGGAAASCEWARGSNVSPQNDTAAVAATRHPVHLFLVSILIG